MQNNLYLLTNTREFEYDQFQGAVVVARNKKNASYIFPDASVKEIEWWLKNEYIDGWPYGWCLPNEVAVQYIGKTDLPEGTVVLAHYYHG